MGEILQFKDKRKTSRTAIGNLVAHLDLRNGSPLIEVCLWNVSRGGACLMVPRGVVLPNSFDLIIDGVSSPVARVWRTDIFAGVSYCGPSAPIDDIA
jgi:hypothetical protein